MKNVLIGLMLFVAGCNAKAQPMEGDCQYTRANVAIKTPADQNVVNSYWQNTKNKYGEYVDRLHLVFSDGSSALIEHKYCAMYNFSIVYYARDRDDINDEKKVADIVDRLFSHNVIKPSFKTPLRLTIESALKSKSYDGKSGLRVGLPEDNVVISDSVEYTLSYYPLGDTDVAEGVVGFYMGVGGQQ